MGQIDSHESRGRRELAGRAAVALGGVGALIGSFQTWADFPVQFSFVSVSGDDLGYGILTGYLRSLPLGRDWCPAGARAA
jgi:hypothetical protein